MNYNGFKAKSFVTKVPCAQLRLILYGNSDGVAYNLVLIYTVRNVLGNDI